MDRHRRSSHIPGKCASDVELLSSNACAVQDEYHRLVQGLRTAGVLQAAHEDMLANPALPQDILNEAVPGNIRRCVHCCAVMFASKASSLAASMLRSQCAT